MRDAVIVSAVRTAVGKAPKGTLRTTRPDEMGAAVIKEAVARVPGLETSEVEDVIMGCAMPEAERHDDQSLLLVRFAVDRNGG
jgi:acetyl-CoA acyltransferase